ncbi:MAG: MBL fold metallo-hydrolase [Chloroflexota bacterium]|nr:MBL fold metallo-hydrolase [Chloroflexota bacterium]
MTTEKFLVRFRGVRGSYPVPGLSTVKVGGNTSCVEVRAGGHLIILDAGTGIISLGRDLGRQCAIDKKPVVATILFSHTHHDHTQGFPFFEPAYFGSSTLYMFGPKNFYEDIEEALTRAMLAPTFPVALDELKSLRVISNVDETEMIVLDQGAEPQIVNIYREEVNASPQAVCISSMRSFFHPKGGVTIYSIEWAGKKLVYASDTEGYVGGDTRLIRFSKEADLLIHDAQYTAEEYLTGGVPKQGWGHSTPEMATAVAREARVKRLALYHHDPLHDDQMLSAIEREARLVFPNTMLAYEGLTIEL